MTRDKTFLALIFTLFSVVHSMNGQALSDCKVEAWQGRKTNFQVAKIPVYVGKDLQNAHVMYYDRHTELVKAWKKLPNGIFCLTETAVYDSIYIVKDTLQCRDFKMYYFASYKYLATEGKKVEMKPLSIFCFFMPFSSIFK